MKFVVAKNRRYFWPIKVRLPAEDAWRAGTVTEFTFKAQFEAIDSEESKAIKDQVANLPVEERLEHQHDLLLRVVVGWDEDIVDADNQPIPFSTEMLEELLRDQWVSLAFWRAWGEALTGDGARKGN